MTWLLAWLLGGLAADRFYLGKYGTAILKLITMGGLGLWYIYDVVITLMGRQHDKSGQSLSGHESAKTMAWIVTLIGWFVFGISGSLYYINM